MKFFSHSIGGTAHEDRFFFSKSLDFATIAEYTRFVPDVAICEEIASLALLS